MRRAEGRRQMGAPARREPQHGKATIGGVDALLDEPATRQRGGEARRRSQRQANVIGEIGERGVRGSVDESETADLGDREIGRSPAPNLAAQHAHHLKRGVEQDRGARVGRGAAATPRAAESYLHHASISRGRPAGRGRARHVRRARPQRRRVRRLAGQAGSRTSAARATRFSSPAGGGRPGS